MTINPRVQQQRLKQVPWRLRWGEPVVSITMNDLKLFVDLGDSGGGLIMYLNQAYEAAETSWLKQTLKPGMVVIDVGAHIGYFTTLAAQLVGPTGRVIALEPDPHNFDLLTKNIARNGLRNVRLLPVAAGSCIGQAELFRSADNHGDHRLVDVGDRGPGLPIPLTTLDEIVRTLELSTVDVIKIDVQGYEPYVLAGAQALLAAQTQLKIISEFWPHGLEQAGHTAPQFFSQLEDLSLRASLLTATGQTQSVDWPSLQQAVPNLAPEHPDIFTNLVWEHV